jgi:lipopolysaccharide transport system ATP-binding protein
MSAPTSAPMSKDDDLVVVENLSKKFCRGLKRSMVYGLADFAGELAGKPRRESLRPFEFHALRDVSFRLKRGEALGLVGPNGSGKTTLLRVISGLIKPESGSVRVRGTLAPLIALGAGFNPVLTGRENVFINMAILGLTQKEIEKRLPEVTEFAELGDALDSPVQTYSSGMHARLGFACAVHTSPDVLLIDEILSVGDMSFRIKCYNRLAKLRKEGTAFLLVSHSPTSILSICDSAIYLRKGRMVMNGSSEEVMLRYEADLLGHQGTAAGGKLSIPPKSKPGPLDIAEVSLVGPDGQAVTELESGRPATLRVRARGREALGEIGLTVIVREMAADNTRILELNSNDDGVLFKASSGEVTFDLKLPQCGLKPSIYTAKILLTQGGVFYVLDAVESFVFKVKVNPYIGLSNYYQPRAWDSRSV